MIDFNQYFEYKDGCLYWKSHPSNKAKLGSKAGGANGNGYLSVRLMGKAYYVHRVIYIMHHGECPHLIDHIDGNILNNRIENLRKATKAQNALNSKISCTNTSGIKGVSREKRYGGWRAKTRVNGREKHIGVFRTKEEAELAYLDFVGKAHGEFFRKS